MPIKQNIKDMALEEMTQAINKDLNIKKITVAMTYDLDHGEYIQSVLYITLWVGKGQSGELTAVDSREWNEYWADEAGLPYQPFADQIQVLLSDDLEKCFIRMCDSPTVTELEHKF